MRLRSQLILPVDYREFTKTPEAERWDALVKYLDKLNIAFTDDRREVSKVVNYNESRLSVGAGYVKYTNEFIIQAGSAGRTDAGTVAVTFPVAFSSTTYYVNCTFRDIASGGDGTQTIAAPVASRAVGGFTATILSESELGALTFDWLAIEFL